MGVDEGVEKEGEETGTMAEAVFAVAMGALNAGMEPATACASEGRIDEGAEKEGWGAGEDAEGVRKENAEGAGAGAATG